MLNVSLRHGTSNSCHVTSCIDQVILGKYLFTSSSERQPGKHNIHCTCRLSESTESFLVLSSPNTIIVTVFLAYESIKKIDAVPEALILGLGAVASVSCRGPTTPKKYLHLFSDALPLECPTCLKSRRLLPNFPTAIT